MDWSRGEKKNRRSRPWWDVDKQLRHFFNFSWKVKGILIQFLKVQMYVYNEEIMVLICSYINSKSIF